MKVTLYTKFNDFYNAELKAKQDKWFNRAVSTVLEQIKYIKKDGKSK